MTSIAKHAVNTSIQSTPADNDDGISRIPGPVLNPSMVEPPAVNEQALDGGQQRDKPILHPQLRWSTRTIIPTKKANMGQDCESQTDRAVRELRKAAEHVRQSRIEHRAIAEEQ